MRLSSRVSTRGSTVRAVWAVWKSMVWSKAASSPRTASVCQGLSSALRSGSASSSCCATSLASPTTATSAGHQRPMCERTASTWMSGTGGSALPELMVRELRATPMANTQSACSTWRRATEVEDDPKMPMS